MSSPSTKAAPERRAPVDDELPDPRSHGMYECAKCHCRAFAEVASGEPYTGPNGSCDGSLVLTRSGTVTPWGDDVSRWVEAPPAYSVQ
jgi:hypothetical protein